MKATAIVLAGGSGKRMNSSVKKAMPILSFPGVQLIGHTVDELVRSGELQAQCMKAVADRFASYCRWKNG